MASHLLFTEWIDTRAGPTPDLIEDGYPLGPHAIVSATAKATRRQPDRGLRRADRRDRGPRCALTAYGALRRRPRLAARAGSGARGQLPYLGAAYLAQGAFKEPMLGLALLGFALSLPRSPGWRGYEPGQLDGPTAGAAG